MIWFYFIIVFLLCPNTSTVANSSSIANQLASTTTNGNGNGNGAITKSCFHKEKQALLHFKVSISQDPFGELSTWKGKDDDCCKWSGVTCNNQTGHVTTLYLQGCVLEGEISPSLVNLTYLNHLDLSWNYFNGTIPNFIGSMTQLRHLDLSHNFLHGNIPPELGNLTYLRSLSLGNSERTSTVENLGWLAYLFHLQDLDMDGISLAKANRWVDAILSLSKLSSISLEGCDLSKVMHPYTSYANSSSYSSIQFLSVRDNNLNSSMYHWLFPLTSNRLISLDLSGNMLDGIPNYIGNLCSLTSLDFSSNSIVVNLTGFLNSLFGCTSTMLQNLDASSSQFIGSLSNEIQQFSSLQSLKLSYNQLTGIMSEKVWELPNLQTLYVFSNSLVITPSIGTSKLWYIDLSNNSLIEAPSKAYNLFDVKYLYLSACNLGPLFPKWIQTHKNLTRLDISNNKIADINLVEFWNTWPSQLTYLNISSNNIHGKVPDLSSNFDLYSRIDLSSNSFYGPIPIVSPSLVSLNLSKNKFYGGISFICQIVDGFLSYLDLSHNSFTGQVPDCLWHFKELRVLNLGNNNLFGRLPASIGYLVQLEVLHLYNNSLFGELSLSLKNCTELKFLNLGANEFLGNVPIWVGESLPWLYGLSLRSNNFFGPIPIQLCHLVNLQILDLSINNLNGTIPSCLNNLNAIVQGRFMSGQNMHDYGIPDKYYNGLDVVGSYVDNAIIGWQGKEQEFTNNLGLLTSIDLSSNNLTGQLPNELVDLHELHVMNLSNNALFGVIPQRIGEMKELLILDFSRNSFSGRMPSSMSKMTSLGWLDVSYNKLSGRIPSSTQLQSFEPSSYTGNEGLCGPPLTKNCPGDEVPHTGGENESIEDDIDELERWFYIGGGSGFATGFWITCGVLLLYRRGRHAFFPFVDFMKDWVYVKVVVFIRKVSRVPHT